MRILVIGNSKSAEILTNFLSENKDLLVFTTKEGTDGNFIDINPKDVEELKEFALANEINLSIAADIGPVFLSLLATIHTCGFPFYHWDQAS